MGTTGVRQERRGEGRRRWPLLILVTALAIAGAEAGAVAAPSPARAAAPSDASTVAAEAQFLQLANSTRQAAGLAPLQLDPAIAAVARAWSAHMSDVHDRVGDPVVNPAAPTDCEQSALCHRPDLAAAVGATEPNWTLIGENLGLGRDVGAIHDALLASPAHQANELGGYNRVGVGVVQDGADMWVTFDFLAGPAAAPPAAPPDTPPVEQAVATPSPPSAPFVAVGSQGRFNAVSPVRIADTRSGVGGRSTPIGPGQELRLPVAGAAAVPAGATGVVVNLTVTDPEAAGFVTAYPCGSAAPLASNVNVRAGETRANLASVALDSTGMLCVTSSMAANVVVDLAGWFGASGDDYLATTPVRVLDSRQSGGPSTAFTVAMAGLVPAGTSAVTANLTVTNPAAAGYLTAYPCGDTPPVVSNVNFAAGQTVPNLATVKLGAGDAFCLASPVPTDVLVDVAGSYTSRDSRLTGAVPSRLLDTRDGTGGWIGRLGAMQRIEVAVAGVRGIPAGATSVALNLTVTGSSAPGYVVAFPCDQALPTVSNVNFDAGDTVANLAVVPLAASGSLCLLASAATHIVADVAGWYTG